MLSKKHLWWAGAIAVYTLIIGYLFRHILFNIDSQLYDWNDYPLMVWIIDQHLDHIMRGEWTQLFQSNMFYPFKDSLLFSDLLLPSTFIVLVVRLFTSNLITAFNITFFITLLLNFIASWVLWRKTWQGPLLVLATFGTALMPFVIVNMSHFQMITLWPFLLGFAQLLNNKQGKWQPVWLGIWTSITFVSSVYLAIFLMYCTGIWLLVQWLAERKTLMHDWKKWTIWLGLFVVTVLALAGPFMYRYYQVRQFYDAQRSYEEYANYSASVFDYFSSASYTSVISTTPLVAQFNKLLATSVGGFSPTYILLILASFSLVFFQCKKPLRMGLGLPVTRSTVFFGILLLSGFIFSLGPRLRVGSVYIGPPLPYAVLLDFIPLFEPIRATARWVMLTNIGVLFFALLGLEKLLKFFPKKLAQIIIGLVLIIYFAEILPVHAKYELVNQDRLVATHLADLCDEEKVLLEYPFDYEPFRDGRDLYLKLQHWTSISLDATAHDCRVVNGYSGFSPKDYDRFYNELDEVLNASQSAAIPDLLEQRDVDLLRIHTEKLTATQSATLETWQTETGFETVFEGEGERVVEVVE